MKKSKIIYLPLLLIIFYCLPLVVTAQSPQVPHKMNFAGMSLTIRDDARAEIQKDVDALTRVPKYFSIKVESARSYFPIIESIFREESIPDDFKYLVLQESALIPDAVSTSNAVGYWQFKEETAREFGLQINSNVDERMNITSATRGAARYFKKSYATFGNWVLVVQSYQMGIGGTMRSHGTKFNGLRQMDITSDTYWYVKKFLAHKVAFENSWAGIPSVLLTPVLVRAETSLEQLALQRGVPPDKIKAYNKWAKTDVIPGDREYVVILPAGDLGSGIASTPIASSVGNFSESQDDLIINGLKAVRARKGESLQAIARRTNVRFTRFLRWNDLDQSDRAVTGNIYYLESKRRSAQMVPVVTTGKETLWHVGQQSGVRLSFLKKYNPGLGEGLLLSGTAVRVSPEKGAARLVEVIEVDPRRPFDWSSGQ